MIAETNNVSESDAKESETKIIAPVKNVWDDFFDSPPCPDFPDRAPQGEYEVRESLDP